MRIFDRIASGESVISYRTGQAVPAGQQAVWRKRAHSAVRVVADESAQFVYQCDRTDWQVDRGDFGTQMTPFPDTWVEWIEPSTRFIGGKWHSMERQGRDAFFLRRRHLDDGRYELVGHRLMAMNYIAESPVRLRITVTKDAWTCASQIEWDDRDLRNLRLSLFDSRSEHLSDEQVAQALGLEHWPLYLALGWMNTRKGGTYADSVPPGVRRRRERSGHFAGLDYHRIIVDDRTSKALQRNRRLERRGLPLHHVRGSFATYTPERPLFGKWVGRLWRDGHTRGDKSLGTIHHEYHVTSEAAQ